MRKSLILSLVAALIAVAMPAFAGEGEFTLNLKSLVVGGRYVDLDSNSAKFNEYRDVSNGAAVPTLKIEGKNADLARWMMIELYNVGQRDARYAMFYDVSGKYSFALDYNKIPHRYMNDATLLLEEVSPGNFLVADPVQKSLQGLIDAQYAISKPGVNFAFLNGLVEPYLATAQRLDVGIQRDRLAARVDFGKSGNFGWGLEYKHENRTGSRPFGAAFGFGNVVELPEPIDYDIDDAKLGAEWRLGKGALRFGYTYSKFENNVDRLYWDNPFRFTDSTDASAYQAPSSSSVAGGSRGFAALNPDNKRDGFYANGNWRFGKKTYLNFSLNEFNLKQNEALTPFTLNTSILDPLGRAATNLNLLPQATADRKVTVTNASADFGTRFAEAFSLRLRYRYYDYDNKGEPIDFEGYVRYHGVWEDIPREAEPFGYTRDSLSGEVGWELGKGMRLGLEYKMDSMDRIDRDVESADDDVLRLTFDGRLGNMVVRAAIEDGSRSTSAYEEDATMPAGARRFDEAEKDYNRYNARLEWNPGEKWSFAVGVDDRKDEYNKSVFGLDSDEITTYNAELSFSLSEKSSLYAFYQVADRSVFMKSRQSGGTPSVSPLDNWEIAFDESNDYFGGGFTFGTEKVKVDLTASWAKSSGNADFSAYVGGQTLTGRPAGTTNATDIPNYEDIESLTAQAKVEYSLMKNVGLGFLYRYEDYSIDSFIIANLDDYLPAALLLNGNRGDYTGNVGAIYLKFTY